TAGASPSVSKVSSAVTSAAIAWVSAESFFSQSRLGGSTITKSSRTGISLSKSWLFGAMVESFLLRGGDTADKFGLLQAVAGRIVTTFTEKSRMVACCRQKARLLGGDFGNALKTGEEIRDLLRQIDQQRRLVKGFQAR